VSFNGTPASFHVVSDTLLITYVPSGETGFVRVNLPQGADDALTVFRVTPQITGFSPATGMVGDAVTVTGNGLIQTDAIAVGGVRATTFTVNSDSKVTFRLPQGARTGQITLTTPGGSVTSHTAFAVHG